MKFDHWKAFIRQVGLSSRPLISHSYWVFRLYTLTLLGLANSSYQIGSALPTLKYRSLQYTFETRLVGRLSEFTLSLHIPSTVLLVEREDSRQIFGDLVWTGRSIYWALRWNSEHCAYRLGCYLTLDWKCWILQLLGTPLINVNFTKSNTFQ